MNISIERTIDHYEVKRSQVDGKIIIVIKLGPDNSAIQLNIPSPDAKWLCEQIERLL